MCVLLATIGQEEKGESDLLITLPAVRQPNALPMLTRAIDQPASASEDPWVLVK